jgi:AraC family transcriptional regulator
MTELSTRREATHRDIAASVAVLLDNARLALSSDRAAAESWIARASAIVRAEADGGNVDDHGSVLPARGGLAPWQLRRVIAHIDANLAASILVRDFNQITGLSTSYFARAFKVSVGESVHAYIIRRRIEHARELMLDTDESLAQITFACGLSDQAHLSRLFRRVIGVSPFVWRRQWRGDGGGTREGLAEPHTYPRGGYAERDHLVAHLPAPRQMAQGVEAAA